jgi:ribosome-binding protein aMBF1 (putative translation factor)
MTRTGNRLHLSRIRDIVSGMPRGASDRRPTAFPGFSSVSKDPVELIGRLAALRRSRGLSQTEVAARMGTSQSALARLESGQADVRVSTLARYAAAIDTGIGFSLREVSE